MIKTIGVSLLLVFVASSAFGQDVAAVDPNATLPSIEPVMEPCRVVAADPESGDPAGGICVGATRTFLTGLDGLAVAESDQAITNLVVALTPLAQEDGVCNELDDEIAAAIRLASAAASTEAQQLQLAEIAQTITDDCATGTTAAVPTPLVDNGDTLSPA